MSEPKFFEAVLQEVKGDVLAKVYPENVRKYGSPMVTMAERLGSEEGKCPECGENSWWLHPHESVAVREGGKPYVECLHCGYITHL